MLRRPPAVAGRRIRRALRAPLRFLLTKLVCAWLRRRNLFVLHRLFASSVGELRCFTAFTTFGAPLDVTVASLRVEHLFPADEATRAALAN